MGWFKDAKETINNIVDIADQAVTDKDKLNELKFHLSELKEQTYQAELATKTVPWIDGLHKMGRQILSLINMGVIAYLLLERPDIEPLSLAMLAGPGAVYNYVKGKGK